MREAYNYHAPNTPRQPQHDYSATVVAPMPPERTSGPENVPGCAMCGEVHGCSHSADEYAGRRTAIASKPAAKPEVTETARYVKSLRAQLGLTQAEFAEKCGVGIQSIYWWEAGLRTPRKTAMIVMESLRNQQIDDNADKITP